MSTSETATLPAPAVDWRPAVRNKWARVRAFQQLLPQLLDTHRGEYVVIHEGRVVDSGQDDLALRSASLRNTAMCPFMWGLVTDEPERVTRISFISVH